MSDDPSFDFKDPTRIGESVMNVMDPKNDHEHSGHPLEDYLLVWSKVLELAGHKAPPELLGWVPVFAPKSNSPEDVAQAKEINLFVAEVASIEGLNFDKADDYWKVVELMWERIQKQKEKQKELA